MKFSSNSAKLGAVLVAFVSLAAVATPAGAESWRGDRSGTGYSGYARGAVEQTRYDGRDDHRYGPPIEYRREMSWRDMAWTRASHHHFHSYRMFDRHGHDRFGR